MAAAPPGPEPHDVFGQAEMEQAFTEVCKRALHDWQLDVPVARITAVFSALPSATRAAMNSTAVAVLYLQAVCGAAISVGLKGRGHWNPPVTIASLRLLPEAQQVATVAEWAARVGQVRLQDGATLAAALGITVPPQPEAMATHAEAMAWVDGSLVCTALKPGDGATYAMCLKPRCNVGATPNSCLECSLEDAEAVAGGEQPAPQLGDKAPDRTLRPRLIEWRAAGVATEPGFFIDGVKGDPTGCRVLQRAGPAPAPAPAAAAPAYGGEAAAPAAASGSKLATTPAEVAAAIVKLTADVSSSSKAADAMIATLAKAVDIGGRPPVMHQRTDVPASGRSTELHVLDAWLFLQSRATRARLVGITTEAQRRKLALLTLLVPSSSHWKELLDVDVYFKDGLLDARVSDFLELIMADLKLGSFELTGLESVAASASSPGSLPAFYASGAGVPSLNARASLVPGAVNANKHREFGAMAGLYADASLDGFALFSSAHSDALQGNANAFGGGLVANTAQKRLFGEGEGPSSSIGVSARATSFTSRMFGARLAQLVAPSNGIVDTTIAPGHVFALAGHTFFSLLTGSYYEAMCNVREGGTVAFRRLLTHYVATVHNTDHTGRMRFDVPPTASAFDTTFAFNRDPALAGFTPTPPAASSSTFSVTASPSATPAAAQDMQAAIAALLTQIAGGAGSGGGAGAGAGAGSGGSRSTNAREPKKFVTLPIDGLAKHWLFNEAVAGTIKDILRKGHKPVLSAAIPDGLSAPLVESIFPGVPLPKDVCGLHGPFAHHETPDCKHLKRLRIAPSRRQPQFTDALVAAIPSLAQAPASAAAPADSFPPPPQATAGPPERPPAAHA